MRTEKEFITDFNFSGGEISADDCSYAWNVPGGIYVVFYVVCRIVDELSLGCEVEEFV